VGAASRLRRSILRLAFRAAPPGAPGQLLRPLLPSLTRTEPCLSLTSTTRFPRCEPRSDLFRDHAPEARRLRRETQPDGSSRLGYTTWALALSGAIEELEVDEVVQAGFTEYLSKPVTMKFLVKTVAQVAGRVT
jgi:hypothetical protein